METALPYPENRPDIDALINLPTGELAAQPVEFLAALQQEIDDAARQLKTITSRFAAALDLRYATRASEARRACGKDTGTVRLVDGEYTVVVDLPKRVEWDQDRLAAVVERIRAAGDDPTQYVDIAIKVPERKYTAWPDAIRANFEPARTVGHGKASFTLALADRP